MTPQPANPSRSEEPVFVSLPLGLAFPSTTYARAFLGLIRAGEQLDRLLDAELRATHGIGLRGYEVLLHLAVFTPDRRAPMTTLIRQAPLSQSRVSRLVAELESRGLVRRSGDERDSRAVVVSLTDEGLRELRDGQQPHHRGLQQRLLSRLNYHELVQRGELPNPVLADEHADG